VAGEPPPDLEEKARAFCDVLNAYDVSYVLVGSMAARLQGARVATIDIDVAPAPAEDNLQRLADALNTLRPRWRIENRPEGAKIDGRLEPAISSATRLRSVSRRGSEHSMSSFASTASRATPTRRWSHGR